jgi:4-carboxymuconolactone decarboxylase
VARVPYVDPATASPDVADTLGRLPPLHVFGLLAHAETVFRSWVRHSHALLTQTTLDPLLRELVILQVGRLAARYEWEQHVPIALACGATEEQVAALDRGDYTAFPAAQRAALTFTEMFVRDGAVDDPTYAALAAELDDGHIVELAVVAGHYLGLARLMTALRIDPDPPAGPAALGLA